MEKINIIVDTLEKKDLFLFKSYADVVISKEHLKTGDYSIRGYTESITIDRKANAAELYSNFGKDWKRFAKELDRMVDYDLAYFAIWVSNAIKIKIIIERFVFVSPMGSPKVESKIK